MNKTKFIVLLSLFLFFIFPSITTNVMGATAEYYYGFEGTTATYQVSVGDYGNGFFNSWDDNAIEELSYVDTSFAYEGAKSYRVHDEGAGNNNVYFNSTVSELYLVNTSFWIYFESGDSQVGLNCIEIYNYATDTPVWRLFFESDSSTAHLDFGYFDHNSVEQIIELSVIDDEWHNIWVSWNSNDSINIGIRENDGTTSEVTAIQPYDVVDNPNFNRTRWYCSAQFVQEQYWIDFFNVTLSSTPYGEGYEHQDLTDYNVVCQGGNSYQQLSNKKYVEDKYFFKLTGDIGAIELFISNDQYSQVSNDKTDYYCNLNGFPLGNPTEIVKYSTVKYQLRWLNLNVQLTEDYPVFEFYCNAYTYSAGTKIYWKGIGLNPQGGGYKYHNSLSKLNGIYDGTLDNMGLSMCFYYINALPTPPEYADIDEISGTSENNIYTECSSELFSYTISTATPNTYIRLYKDGTKVTTQGYESKIAKPYAGTCSYSFDQDSSGSYSLHLNRSGVALDYYNFTVIELPNEWDYNAQIWTTPILSGSGDTFTITWIYNKTYYDNKSAYIIFTEHNYIAGVGYKVLKTNVKNNGSMQDSIIMEMGYENQYYYHIAVVTDGAYESIIYCSHWVDEYNTNTIKTDKTYYELQDDTHYGKLAIVTISGTHSFLNQNVFVLINNGDVAKTPVSSTTTFGYYQYIYDTGFYNVKLVKYTSNTTYKTYAQTNFTVGDIPEDELVDEFSLQNMIDTYLNDEQQFLAGIFIIGFFVFLPVYINYQWSEEKFGLQHALEIPHFVYLVMFIIAYVINIYFELFDIYTIVIIGFFLGIILAYKIVDGYRSNTSGD